MSVTDEKRMATTEIRMVRWAMGLSLFEHRRNEEILKEMRARVEPLANGTVNKEMKQNTSEYLANNKLLEITL